VGNTRCVSSEEPSLRIIHPHLFSPHLETDSSTLPWEKTKRATAIPLSQATIVLQADENIPALEAIRYEITVEGRLHPRNAFARGWPRGAGS